MSDYSRARKATLPRDWPARRDAVKRRACGRCEARLHTGRRCPEKGTDADHVDDRLDHTLPNLAWLCPTHHDTKSARQGAEAAAALQARALFPSEKHPGND